MTMKARILFGANPGSNDGMTPHSSPSTTLKDSLSFKRFGKRGLTRCVPLTAQTTQNTAPYATQQRVQRMMENAMCLVLFSKPAGLLRGFKEATRGLRIERKVDETADGMNGREEKGRPPQGIGGRNTGALGTKTTRHSCPEDRSKT